MTYLQIATGFQAPPSPSPNLNKKIVLAESKDLKLSLQQYILVSWQLKLSNSLYWCNGRYCFRPVRSAHYKVLKSDKQINLMKKDILLLLTIPKVITCGNVAWTKMWSLLVKLKCLFACFFRQFVASVTLTTYSLGGSTNDKPFICLVYAEV